MWPTTRATELLNIHYPIIQAPMAGVTTPALVAAVSNAGGLGSFGGGYSSPELLREAIRKIRSLTTKPFAVNLFMPPQAVEIDQLAIDKLNDLLQPYRDELNIPRPQSITKYMESFADQMEVVLSENVPVFSFTFGIPEKQWIKKLKARSVVMIGTATSVNEAEKNQKADVDLIVAQGLEAGGHRGAFLETEGAMMWNTIELLPQIIKKVDIPVIAAGGLMNAEDLYAALQLRASAVQMGSAFLACDESAAHPKYKDAVMNLKENDTVISKVFSGKYSRGILNRFVDELVQHEELILPFPLQGACVKDIRQAAAMQGREEFMAMWAGSYAYLAKPQSAEKLMQELIQGMQKLA